MKDIQFNWWPWKLLALLVPVVATAAGIVHTRQPSARADELAPVLLGMLGAGNAYIIAAASGNLGRLLLAVPVGVGAAFLSLLLLSFQPALLVYGTFLCLWSVLAVMGWSMKRGGADLSSGLGGCLLFVLVSSVLAVGVALLMTLSGIPISGASAGDHGYVLFIVVPLSFPFVSACLAACLIPEKGRKGPAEGFCDAITSSLRALLFSVLASVPLLIAAATILKKTRVNAGDSQLLAGGMLLSFLNYFFLSSFFSAITRDASSATKVTPSAQPGELSAHCDNSPGAEASSTSGLERATPEKASPR